jgi:hypothetical protein
LMRLPLELSNEPEIGCASGPVARVRANAKQISLVKSVPEHELVLAGSKSRSCKACQ